MSASFDFREQERKRTERKERPEADANGLNQIVHCAPWVVVVGFSQLLEGKAVVWWALVAVVIIVSSVAVLFVFLEAKAMRCHG
jgi:hypothetical protein